MSSMIACARRAAFASLLIGGLLAGSDAARAGTVVTQLSGTIDTVHGANAATSKLLLAHGVLVGNDVDISFTIESTTPKDPVPPPPYSYYPGAITAMTIAAGTWEATLSIPAGLESLDFVQVGDDVATGAAVSDTYLLAAPGADTDAILQGELANAVVSMQLIFGDGDGQTIADEGVVQDATLFSFGLGHVSGDLGEFTIAFGESRAGGTGVNGPGVCRQGQLKAAGKFGSAMLKAMGTHSSSPPEKDPQGAKEAAAIDAAELQFAIAFNKAISKAFGKDGTAPLPSSEEGTAADDIEGNIQDLADALRTGADPENKADRALRGALFKAARTMVGKDWGSYAGDAVKPSSTKLAAALAKARTALQKSVDKAIAAAAKKGVTFTGPSSGAIADSIEALVDEFSQMTEGLGPATAAAAAQARQYCGASATARRGS